MHISKIDVIEKEWKKLEFGGDVNKAESHKSWTSEAPVRLRVHRSSRPSRVRTRLLQLLLRVNHHYVGPIPVVAANVWRNRSERFNCGRLALRRHDVRPDFPAQSHWRSGMVNRKHEYSPWFGYSVQFLYPITLNIWRMYRVLNIN